MERSSAGASLQSWTTELAIAQQREGALCGITHQREATPIGAIRIAASQELQLPAPRVMLTDAHGQGWQLSTEASHQLRPVGRVDPSDTRIEVLPPLGAESQHVLANEASPASILACPNVGPAAYLFAAAQMRSRRGHRHRQRASGAGRLTCDHSGGSVLTQGCRPVRCSQ